MNRTHLRITLPKENMIISSENCLARISIVITTLSRDQQFGAESSCFNYGTLS